MQVLSNLERHLTANPDYKRCVIYDAKQNELFVYLGEATDEMTAEILQDVESLPSGNYTLKSNKNQSGGTGTKVYPFTIPTAQKNTVMNGNFSADYIEKIKQEAYQQGHKDAQIKILEHKIDTLQKDFEAFKIKVADKFDTLDGNEDEDILTKGVDILGKVSQAKNHLSDFKF